MIQLMLLCPKASPPQCALWPTSLPFAQHLALPWGDLEMHSHVLAANSMRQLKYTYYVQIGGFLLARHLVRHLELPLRTKRFLHTPSWIHRCHTQIVKRSRVSFTQLHLKRRDAGITYGECHVVMSRASDGRGTRRKSCSLIVYVRSKRSNRTTWDTETIQADATRTCKAICGRKCHSLEAGKIGMICSNPLW